MMKDYQTLEGLHLCVTKVFYSIKNIPYMVIGSSMSWTPCDKVSYGCCIISVTEEYDKVLLNVGSLVVQ